MSRTVPTAAPPGATPGTAAPSAPPAGWMLVPYVAWVAFATALTLAVWAGNPAMR